MLRKTVPSGFSDRDGALFALHGLRPSPGACGLCVGRRRIADSEPRTSTGNRYIVPSTALRSKHAASMGNTDPSSTEPETQRITLALGACAAGDPAASEELFALVYEGLRRLAQSRMKGERLGHTLQPTALVHEAFVRLVGGGQVAWQSRAHFFAAAGEAMRRILVDRARARARLKRGGDGRRAPGRAALSELTLSTEPEPGLMLLLDDALAQLERDDPQAATIVRLRFFAGLSVAEIAEALGVSPRSVDRDWAYARARLHQLMRAASE